MVKFDRSQPTPPHEKLRHSECYAKCILEYFFPDRYTNLEIKDCPDLVDVTHNIGIEVVSADSQQKHEALSLESQLAYLDVDDPRSKRLIERLNQIGYNYTFERGLEEPFEILPSETTDIEKTSVSIFLDKCKDKIKKLNSGNYVDFACYDLFAQSRLYIEDWMIPKLLEKLMQINGDANKNFVIIHLHSFNRIDSFDMLKGTCHTIYIDQNLLIKLEQLGWDARHIVEDCE